MNFEQAWSLAHPGETICQGDYVLRTSKSMTADFLKVMKDGQDTERGWKVRLHSCPECGCMELNAEGDWLLCMKCSHRFKA